MARYYDELLKLCGFEAEEINKESPRIEEVFRRLQLGPEDMKKAEKWVTQNHDVELMGMRKILGMWLRELFDLVLAKEEGKKLLYYGFPTMTGPGAAIAASSEEILCVCPDVVLCHTMGQIFNKLTPILEAGEENGLPAGHGLCSLQQVRVGGMALGIIPVPDLVLTSSYSCDMGSKADELLHERYGHPAAYVDGSQDSKWGEYPGYQPARVDFWSQQINKAFDKVREVFGVAMTQEVLNEGATRSRELVTALNELVELVKEAEPQPISIVEIQIARRLINGSASRRIMTEAPKAISLLTQEVKERVDRGIGVVEAGAPRAMIFMTHHSDPNIIRMVENCGLSIPVTYLDLAASRFGKGAPLASAEIMAEQHLARGWFHSNYADIKLVTEVVQQANVDGVIWNYLYNCRPLSQPARLLKHFVEKETGVPVLPLEFDLADNRTYSAAALRTRVETFAEILRVRKANRKK